MRAGVGNRGEGFVLVAVMVVVMLSSMVAVSLIFRMQAEQAATTAGMQAEQGWSAAMSGVREAMRVAGEIAPGSLDWRDAEELFHHREVHDDGVERWYFTVYSMGDGDGGEVRYGLTDEASRVNINRANTPWLQTLMPQPEVDALRDYIDFDDQVRGEGAEGEAYLAPGLEHEVRNGPLTTLGEILLVRGFTPALLYGEDANQNSRLDANEDDGGGQFPPDNADGRLETGLRRDLTVHSYDPNVDNLGLARKNLNDPNEAFHGFEMPASLPDYIHAMRLEGSQFQHPAELLDARRKFAAVKGLDRDGREVEWPERELSSGVGLAEIGRVLDQLTATSDATLPGLINVNTASKRVLAAVPGIEEELAESIVRAREGLDDQGRQNLKWLLNEGVVEAGKFREIAPFLTTRAWQFGFRSVGYALPSGRYRVLDVVIDVAGEKPVVSYLRDDTRLGLPFRVDLEEEGEDG